MLKVPMTFVRTSRRKMPAVSRPSVSGQHRVQQHVLHVGGVAGGDRVDEVDAGAAVAADGELGADARASRDGQPAEPHEKTSLATRPAKKTGVA
jgi:hypothetical protein